jgi:hypothetical protein
LPYDIPVCRRSRFSSISQVPWPGTGACANITMPSVAKEKTVNNNADKIHQIPVTGTYLRA